MDTDLPTAPGRLGMGRRQPGPFLDCILGSHGKIASAADREQIREGRSSALAFGNIMTDMKIVNGHVIFTPVNNALAFVATTHVRQPDLLPQRLRNCCF